MTLTSPSDFIGEISIANRSDMAVMENLQTFIDKYEKRFLDQLLGDELAGLFRDGLDVAEGAEIDPKWVALRDLPELKEAAASYVYYWYMRDQAVQTSGIGTVATKGENATRVSPDGKMVRAWNEMVLLNWELHKYVGAKLDLYPEYLEDWMFPYRKRCMDIFQPINSLNL